MSGGYATMRVVPCPHCKRRYKKGYWQIRDSHGACNNTKKCEERRKRFIKKSYQLAKDAVAA